jgi:hypothetical protein
MPSVSCPGINADIFLDCTKPLSAGVKDMLYLVNFADIASIVEDISNPNLIESFTLAPNSFLYQFEGKNNSIDPKSSLVKARYSNTFNHELIFKVFDNASNIKQQLEYMTNVKIVAIVENNFKGSTGEVPFEIYGLRSGLTINVLERIVNDQETQGAYNITLSSSEQIKEPYLPATLFDTSYAITKAFIESLFFSTP